MPPGARRLPRRPAHRCGTQRDAARARRHRPARAFGRDRRLRRSGDGRALRPPRGRSRRRPAGSTRAAGAHARDARPPPRARSSARGRLPAVVRARALMHAVVMAAGEGTRLRPLTDRWPKPILPIDGRPVIATLLREVAAAGCERVYVVTGYLAEQVEALVGDGSGFGLDVRFARQPGALGSADAVRRALAVGAEPPLLVTAADTVFTAGDIKRFVDAAHGAAGALAYRLEPAPDPPHREAVRVVEGRVERV